MSNRRFLITLIAGIALLYSCGPKNEEKALHNGAYYWKTTFALDSAEIHFLKVNSVDQLYIRYFDVDVDKNHGLVPRATIQFPAKAELDSLFNADSLTFDVVPTVFITNDAIKFLSGSKDLNKASSDFAEKLIKRINAMSMQHGLNGRVKEIQLDCDWTISTQEAYFALCTQMKKHSDVRISSTIRLHQLRMQCPPVDEGVLMLYNTGDFRKWDTRNSIIDADEVAKYLKSTTSYSLPLKAAYPNYSWDVYFYNENYFAFLGTNKDAYETGYKRHEDSPYEVISEVKKMVLNSKLKIRGNIIYHLDSSNISKYTDEQIKNIYR